MTVFGLELDDDLEDGAIPTAAVVIYQYLDGDGEAQLGWTSTHLPNWEVLGMAESLAAWVRSCIAVDPGANDA